MLYELWALLSMFYEREWYCTYLYSTYLIQIHLEMFSVHSHFLHHLSISSHLNIGPFRQPTISFSHPNSPIRLLPQVYESYQMASYPLMLPLSISNAIAIGCKLPQNKPINADSALSPSNETQLRHIKANHSASAALLRHWAAQTGPLRRTCKASCKMEGSALPCPPYMYSQPCPSHGMLLSRH